MPKICPGLLLTAALVLSSTAIAFTSVGVPPPTQIPEPSTFHLLGTGLAALLGSTGIYNLFKK